MRDPVRLTETEAIAGARTGDHRAFAWIVAEFKHLVFTVTMRVLRNREEAEEASQDAFVKAYQNLSTYQGGSKLSTWLFSIAYRTAISKLRSRRAGSTDLDEALDVHMTDGSQANFAPADRKNALDHALSQLPPNDASIVSLFYLHEQSVEEIVTVTGLTASNVKVKLHRSRKKMFDVLHHHLKEEIWTLQED